MPRPAALKASAATAIVASVVVLTAITWAHASTGGGDPVTIAMTAAAPVATPRLVVAQQGQLIVVSNGTDADLQLMATAHSPAAFQVSVPTHGTASLTLSVPGLYHYYDAATAAVIDYQAANDVMQALPGAPNPYLPDQGWIFVPGPEGVPTDAQVDVPANHDLLAPRAAVIRVGGSIVFHNHDTDAHNLVTDLGDPTGAAFEVLGTDGEPALGGAERRITFTKPGLYHVYCSIHTRSVGSAGRAVVARRDDSATGFADSDPMEAWVLVIQ